MYDEDYDEDDLAIYEDAEQNPAGATLLLLALAAAGVFGLVKARKQKKVSSSDSSAGKWTIKVETTPGGTTAATQIANVKVSPVLDTDSEAQSNAKIVLVANAINQDALQLAVFNPSQAAGLAQHHVGVALIAPDGSTVFGGMHPVSATGTSTFTVTHAGVAYTVTATAA